MKRILVTGGTGFIGSHLCARLLDLGHFVICLDNFRTSSERNIEHLRKKANFELIRADTRDVVIDHLAFKGEVSEIYDLASPASVTHIMEHPIEVAMVNAHGTKNMLDIAKHMGTKFLFASTSEAYGDPKEHPQRESYWGNVNPIGARSAYDEGKRFGEALTMAYHREHNLDIKIARIFNTYGPHSDPTDSRVIPSFVTKALSGERLLVHGDGTQTRSFCYVSDMVDGLIKLMESTQTGPMNIGNSEEHTILDIAKKVLTLTASTSEISFVPRPPDDPSVRQPDITRAKQALGWEPKVSLEDGLRLTIQYFRDLL